MHSRPRVAPVLAAQPSNVPWRAAALMAACLVCDETEAASVQLLEPTATAAPPSAALRCARSAALLLPVCLLSLTCYFDAAKSARACAVLRVAVAAVAAVTTVACCGLLLRKCRKPAYLLVRVCENGQALPRA